VLFVSKRLNMLLNDVMTLSACARSGVGGMDFSILEHAKTMSILDRAPSWHR
jgi:hypothetical protein